MIISIVGKSGSGKSTIAKAFQKLDERMMHVDIDKISHQVLTIPEVQETLQNTFGKNIVINHKVQRKVLGEIVFTSREEMQKLINITWYHMELAIDKIISNNKNKIIILDYLLLPKTKYFNQSTLRILVDAPLENRLDRAIKRTFNEDPITKEYFIKRDTAGINYEEKEYDYVIHNIDKDKTLNEVKKIYEKSFLCRQF